MKTAISLPGEVFEAAEELAVELGLSRSQLYARAIEAYVKSKRRAEVAARVKAFYGEEVVVDRAVTRHARKALERVDCETW